MTYSVESMIEAAKETWNGPDPYSVAHFVTVRHNGDKIECVCVRGNRIEFWLNGRKSSKAHITKLLEVGA